MQTFLPYPDLKKSLPSLDYLRLGKQRVETYQILRALKFGSDYSKYPAVKMWRGHANALKHYYNLAIDEWVKRGYRNNIHKQLFFFAGVRRKIRIQSRLSACFLPDHNCHGGIIFFAYGKVI
jgi:hypothetical protein